MRRHLVRRGVRRPWRLPELNGEGSNAQLLRSQFKQFTSKCQAFSNK